MIGQDRPRYDLLTFLKKFEPKNYFILYHWQREVEMCGSSVKATCLIPLRKHPKTFPWLPPPPWGFDHSSVRHNLWSHQLYVIEVIIRYQDALRYSDNKLFIISFCFLNIPKLRTFLQQQGYLFTESAKNVRGMMTKHLLGMMKATPAPFLRLCNYSEIFSLRK